MGAEEVKVRSEAGNELSLARKVARYLTKLRRDGFAVWFLKVKGGIMQRSGVPDYLLCINGRFGALEMKTPQDKIAVPTNIQRQRLKEIHESGGFAWVMNDYQEIVLNIETLLAMPKVAAHVSVDAQERKLYGAAMWNRSNRVSGGVAVLPEQPEPPLPNKTTMKRIRRIEKILDRSLPPRLRTFNR